MKSDEWTIYKAKARNHYDVTRINSKEDDSFSK